jgi:hypothetical protein
VNPGSVLQLGIFLPERPTNEIIEDRLTDYVSEANEPLITPERRVELHAEIVRLRAVLKGAR